MITYELARELKEKGFPQAQEGGKVFKDRDRGDGTMENGFFIKDPSLSELIKECGERFSRLQRTKDGRWGVYDVEYGLLLPSFDSPEEAVANLWLAINRK